MKRSDDWPGKAEPRIVCAANRYFGVEEIEFLLVGPRHYDKTMRHQLAIHDVALCEAGTEADSFDVEQGFIDQFGDFWSRQEAWKIAEKNGQIYRRCGGDTADGGTLYSENLY